MACPFSWISAFSFFCSNSVFLIFAQKWRLDPILEKTLETRPAFEHRASNFFIYCLARVCLTWWNIQSCRLDDSWSEFLFWRRVLESKIKWFLTYDLSDSFCRPFVSFCFYAILFHQCSQLHVKPSILEDLVAIFKFIQLIGDITDFLIFISKIHIDSFNKIDIYYNHILT